MAMVIDGKPLDPLPHLPILLQDLHCVRITAHPHMDQHRRIHPNHRPLVLLGGNDWQSQLADPLIKRSSNCHCPSKRLPRAALLTVPTLVSLRDDAPALFLVHPAEIYYQMIYGVLCIVKFQHDPTSEVATVWRDFV